MTKNCQYVQYQVWSTLVAKKRQTIWTSATLIRQSEEKDREVALGGMDYGVVTMAITTRMALAAFHQRMDPPTVSPYYTVDRLELLMKRKYQIFNPWSTLA